MNREKIKQDETLKHLEEAYFLAGKIAQHASQTRTNMVFSIAALKDQIAFDRVLKTQEELFSRLHALFDFHLMRLLN